MRICHVSRGACPRIVKLAYVQQKRGIETHWIGYTPPSYQTTLPFTVTLVDERRKSIKECVEEMNDKVDAFHVHTHLFDTFILDYVKAYAKKKIIWDCHDKAETAHNFPKLTPTEAFGGTTYKTYCPKDWFAGIQEQRFELVIATGVSDTPGHFRHWLPTFQRLKENGMQVKCYTNSQITKEYQEAAEMIPAIDVVDLVQEMSYSMAGLCGTMNNGPIIQDAQPNKLYEYVAAGIPSICFGKDLAMAKVIQDYKIGVVIDHPDEIYAAINYIRKEDITMNVLEQRGRFTMESQERIVTNFYQKVLYG